MKNILVYGLGKSGVACARLLLKQGYRVFLYDENDTKEGEQLAKEGGILLDDLLDDFINKLSMAVISPGVSICNKNVQRLKQKTKVIGELELGFFNCRGQVVGITGTNGKTTTCSLIKHILDEDDKNAFLLGNVGTPFASKAQNVLPDDVVVLETSSFQLETTAFFKPHISALLNVTPDHLDRHKDMQTYINTKLKIFKNQTENDFAVLNFDDKTVVKNTGDIKAKKIYFSTEQSAYVCIKNHQIYFGEEVVANINNIKLRGKHNLSNILCCVAICKLLGIKNNSIQNGLDSFIGVPHRLQEVGYIGDVLFVNDSKATNVNSVLPSLKAYDKISLILGGSDKGFSFDSLFAKMPTNVRFCILYGEAQDKIFASAQKHGYKNCFFANSFDNSVKIAYYSACPNGTVLLSPACASFDLFDGFESRGKRFCQIFEELKNEEG